MSEEISNLICTNRIAKSIKISYVVNPLSVTAQKVVKRLIINLPHTNKHIFNEGSDLMTGNLCYTIFRLRNIPLKFDFKQGYHSTDIHYEFTKYIAFCWEGKFYVILVLPFGLSLTPYTFTKMKQCILKQFRSLVFRGACFLHVDMITETNYKSPA